MNHKALLELVANGRLTVHDALTLMGDETPTERIGISPAPSKKRRPNKTQTIYTLEDHFAIVNAYIEADGNRAEVAYKLDISPQTVLNHAQYAGLADCTNQDQANRVVTWRRNRKMYLELGAPTVRRPGGTHRIVKAGA